MTFSVKVGGVWAAATAFIKVGGAWKAVTPSVRVGGAWKTSPVPANPASVTPWSDIAAASPAINATNEDRAITWSGGGSRTVTFGVALSGGDVGARKNGAGGYASSQSITSGETIGFRYRPVGNNQSSTPVSVYVDGVLLETFNVSATGY